MSVVIKCHLVNCHFQCKADIALDVFVSKLEINEANNVFVMTLTKIAKPVNVFVMTICFNMTLVVINVS